MLRQTTSRNRRNPVVRVSITPEIEPFGKGLRATARAIIFVCVVKREDALGD
jgi:hypothetical protein